MADLGGAPALPQPSDALVRDGCAPLAQAGYACDSRRTVVGSAQHDAGAGERPKRRSRLSVKDVGHSSPSVMGQVRIISTPPGEAPLDVRRAWVGVVVPLPADHPEEPVRVLTDGVLTAPRTMLGRIWSRLTGRTQWWTGFALEGAECISALARSSPSAAQWWRDNTPRFLEPGHRLVFPSNSCELLRGTRMPNATDVGQKHDRDSG